MSTRYPESTLQARRKASRKWKRSNNCRRTTGIDYKITEEAYDQMLSDQGYRCAICSIHQSEHKYTLHTDHDHKTGEVRGIICRACNHGLGNFRDNTEFMTNAIAYLHRSRMKAVK